MPGLFHDSLPDGWGLLLLDRELRSQGMRLEDISPLQRLAMLGTGGMGALEYPVEAQEQVPQNTKALHLDGLAAKRRDALPQPGTSPTR